VGRKRTKLDLTADERIQLDHLLKTTRDLRQRERLAFAVKAAVGAHTLDDLARFTGRSRSTLQNWIAKFQRGGIGGLLVRDTPPGKQSALLKPEIQTELRQGLKSGELKTAQQVADWLRQRHKLTLARKSVYYWFGKIRSKSDSLGD